MKDLAYDLKKICQQNREGSFSTMAAREKIVIMAGNQLEQLGYKGMKKAEQLKPKHIFALVQHWKETGVADATLKNRMSHMRWVSTKIQNPNLIHPSNDRYEITRRKFVDNKDKSTVFDSDKINSISDNHVRISALLQKEFGLRREEAMKLIPSQADQGKSLVLQGSWTKGGKPRSVPINTESQRKVLDQSKQLVGHGSMIPSARKYVQHMRIFEKQMHRVGLGRTHGARHLYAQDRYRELAGQESPVTGGPSRQSMSKDQRDKDNEVRLQISRELGHERIQIVAVYIGR